MKAKKQKLLFKPTPISRLRHYKSPIKMVGDPHWGNSYSKQAWEKRSRLVYEYEMERKIKMERKGWPMAWKPDTWVDAQIHNARIDALLTQKWPDHEYAISEKKWFDHDAACRDNAAWDYHHEYTPTLETA